MKYIVIVGPTNSGSTVLREVIEGVDGVASLHKEGYNIVSNKAPESVPFSTPEPNHRLLGEYQSMLDNHNLWDFDTYLETLMNSFEQRNMNPLHTYDVAVEKSPVNVWIADDLRIHLKHEWSMDPHFLFLTRHPLVVSEGISRREDVDPRRAASHLNKLHEKMFEQVKRFTGMTCEIEMIRYEDFCRNKRRSANSLERWIPELSGVSFDGRVHHHCVRGSDLRPIESYNREQVENLSDQEKSDVMDILKERSDVYDWFGYDLLAKLSFL